MDYDKIARSLTDEQLTKLTEKSWFSICPRDDQGRCEPDSLGGKAAATRDKIKKKLTSPEAKRVGKIALGVAAAAGAGYVAHKTGVAEKAGDIAKKGAYKAAQGAAKVGEKIADAAKDAGQQVVDAGKAAVVAGAAKKMQSAADKLGDTPVRNQPEQEPERYDRGAYSVQYDEDPNFEQERYADEGPEVSAEPEPKPAQKPKPSGTPKAKPKPRQRAKPKPAPEPETAPEPAPVTVKSAAGPEPVETPKPQRKRPGPKKKPGPKPGLKAKAVAQGEKVASKMPDLPRVTGDAAKGFLRANGIPDSKLPKQGKNLLISKSGDGDTYLVNVGNDKFELQKQEPNKRPPKPRVTPPKPKAPPPIPTSTLTTVKAARAFLGERGVDPKLVPAEGKRIKVGSDQNGDIYLTNMGKRKFKLEQTKGYPPELPKVMPPKKTEPKKTAAKRLAPGTKVPSKGATNPSPFIFKKNFISKRKLEDATKKGSGVTVLPGRSNVMDSKKGEAFARSYGYSTADLPKKGEMVHIKDTTWLVNGGGGRWKTFIMEPDIRQGMSFDDNPFDNRMRKKESRSPMDRYDEFVRALSDDELNSLSTSLKEGWFSDCPRNDKGHCEPKSGGGGGGAKKNKPPRKFSGEKVGRAVASGLKKVGQAYTGAARKFAGTKVGKGATKVGKGLMKADRAVKKAVRKIPDPVKKIARSANTGAGVGNIVAPGVGVLPGAVAGGAGRAAVMAAGKGASAISSGAKKVKAKYDSLTPRQKGALKLGGGLAMQAGGVALLGRAAKKQRRADLEKAIKAQRSAFRQGVKPQYRR